MPPRPTGVDGRDHNYRMVIVDRYKRMAEFKASIEKLLGLHLVFVLLKLAWQLGVSLGSNGAVEVSKSALGMVAGEALTLLLWNRAKTGTSRESLPLLKAFNMAQAAVTATEVLSGWIYHQGVNSGGVPQYAYAVAAAKAFGGGAGIAGLSAEQVFSGAKVFELFLDLTTAVFMALGTLVAHKMIVEKMQMKAEKAQAGAQARRKDAQRGGGSDDDATDSEDGDDAPAAVPLKGGGGEPKAAARTASVRRRLA